MSSITCTGSAYKRNTVSALYGAIAYGVTTTYILIKGPLISTRITVVTLDLNFIFRVV